MQAIGYSNIQYSSEKTRTEPALEAMRIVGIKLFTRFKRDGLDELVELDFVEILTVLEYGECAPAEIRLLRR